MMSLWFRGVCLAALSIAVCVCAPKPVEKAEVGEEEFKDAVLWLKTFGYLKAAGDSEVQDVEEALKQMQEYAGIPVTGVLDEQTVNKMSEPRCGHADVEDEDDFLDEPEEETDVSSNSTSDEQKRSKRFVLWNRRWPRGATLDVSYVNYTRDMSVADQERVMQDVVNEWNSAANVNLLFHRNGERADNSEIRVHHSYYDGEGRRSVPGGTLAYAYYPTGGDVYFDETENWAEQGDARRGTTSYRSVALHELGHSIGLRHSRDRDAVMYAYYSPEKTTLRADDKAGARAIYGRARNQ